MKSSGSEELDHTADTGIRAFGRDLAELFTEAAEGMFRIVLDVKETRPHSQTQNMQLEAATTEELLHAWLTELLYHHAVGHLLPIRIEKVECTPVRLTAAVLWTDLTPDLAALATEIKAVTWHALSVRREDGIWIAEVIFDT